jgi:hypothetical protein
MGMVMAPAHNKFLVTPDRTADTLLFNPTPMMESVMVCVVLTGIPREAVAKSVKAPAVSAANPSNGLRMSNALSHGFYNTPTTH